MHCCAALEACSCDDNECAVARESLAGVRADPSSDDSRLRASPLRLAAGCLIVVGSVQQPSRNLSDRVLKQRMVAVGNIKKITKVRRRSQADGERAADAEPSLVAWDWMLPMRCISYGVGASRCNGTAG